MPGCTKAVILLAVTCWVSTVGQVDAADPSTTDSTTLRKRAGEWAKQGEWDKAIKDLDEAIRLDPKAAEAFCVRAMCRLALGHLPNALLDTEQALRLDSDNPAYLSNRGTVLSALGQVDKAILDFDRAIRLNPKQTDAYVGRSLCWIHRRDFDAAIKDLDEAIRLSPTQAQAYSNRGGAWREKHELDKAIKDHEESIRLDPKVGRYRYNRAMCMIDKSEWKLALGDLNEAVRLEPTDCTILVGRARLLILCPVAAYRDGKTAISDVWRACESTQWAKPEFLVYLAAAYAEAERFDDAVKWQQKVVEQTEERSKPAAEAVLRLYQGKRTLVQGP
jgi:tetratricopeptide (TPR) repeat protein